MNNRLFAAAVGYLTYCCIAVHLRMHASCQPHDSSNWRLYICNFSLGKFGPCIKLLLAPWWTLLFLPRCLCSVACLVLWIEGSEFLFFFTAYNVISTRARFPFVLREAVVPTRFVALFCNDLSHSLAVGWFDLHTPETVYKVPIRPRGNILYKQIYLITKQKLLCKCILGLWNGYFTSDFTLYPVTL